jgi:hypothetical protein
MPPVLCPERLRKFIERVNREGGDEARVFRIILSEIEKQRRGKGQHNYPVKLQCTITINLTDYSANIRSDLADALAEIDPPDLIERIRECPVAHCGHLFWAGTSRKKACDKHGDRVRQANYRREIKRTARAVIAAVMMARKRKFQRIDVETSQILWDVHGFIPSTLVIRKVTHRLHKDGYLDYFPSAENGFSIEDQYYPTQKLIDLWNDSRPRKQS